jgi:site-specific recombinase XerD
MTPLRQRLLHDLRLRNYAPRTITTYVAAVARFAQHFRRSPHLLDAQHVRQYQLHLLAQHASWSRFNQAVCALRFLYDVTLQRPDVVTLIPYGKKPKTLPAVLST